MLTIKATVTIDSSTKCRIRGTLQPNNSNKCRWSSRCTCSNSNSISNNNSNSRPHLESNGSSIRNEEPRHFSNNSKSTIKHGNTAPVAKQPWTKEPFLS